MNENTVMGKKVLVVEDHHDTSFMLCWLLKMEGAEVKHAIDGMVGYSTAATERPDLIITDIQMPRMNGIELIRRNREDDGLRQTPISVMSAYGKRMLDDAIEAGADGFVEKPIDFEKFLNTVKENMPGH